MKSFILSAFFIPFLVANVHAEDLNSAPAPDWAGAYLGVQGGFASGKSLSGGYFLLAPGSDVVGDLDPAGFTGGIHAGYNFQRDTPVVIGIEGDIEYAHIRGSSDLSLNGVPVPSNEMSSEMNWRGSVRARAGYAIDRFLPFVTAGIAFGRYDVTPSYALTGPLPDSSVHVGPTLGLGIEYALTDRLNTRIEYRYTDFGNASYQIPGFGGFFESRTELKTHDIKLGLSYKF